VAQQGTLLGVKMMTKRTGSKRNSPVVAEWLATVEPTVAYTNDQLASFVYRIYGGLTKRLAISA